MAGSLDLDAVRQHEHQHAQFDEWLEFLVFVTSRRKFLTGSSTAALLLCHPELAAAGHVHGIAPTLPQSGGGMLINVASLASNSEGIPGYPFLNWWRATTGQIIVNTTSLGQLVGYAAWTSAGTGAPYFNAATGDLNVPCSSDITSIARNFFTPIGGYSNLTALAPYSGTPFFVGQVLNCSWTGTATPSVPAFSGGVTISNQTTSSCTLTIGSSGVTNVGLQLAITNVNTPPTNIQVIQSQYVGATTAPMNPDWLTDYKPFATIRFLDWNDVFEGGFTDLSQFADDNYNSVTNSMGGQYTCQGYISGTTFTTSSVSGSVRIGCTVADASGTVAGGTIITGGSGSSWTVNILQTAGSSGSKLSCFGSATTAYIGPAGPKGGIHPATVCEIGNAVGCNVHFCVPGGITPAAMTAIANVFKTNLNPNLYVKFEYINENWNSGTTPYYFCTSNTYPPGGSTGGQYLQFAGYRAAQLWEAVYNVYGAGGRKRWKGVLGAQGVSPTTTSNGISGINQWITGSTASISSGTYDSGTGLVTLTIANTLPNSILPTSSVTISGVTGTGSVASVNGVQTAAVGTGSTTLTFTIATGLTLTISSSTGMLTFGSLLANPTVSTLFDEVDIAIYFGASESTDTITGLTTAGATTVLACSNGVNTPTFTVGQVVRLSFSVTTAGTLGQTTGGPGGNSPGGNSILNNQDVVLSARTSSTISFTNYGGLSGSGAIDTTGLTYSAGTNYALKGLFMDLMDTSNANFIATPGTYPTKYTYFAQQVCTSILTGTCANGYTTGNSFNLTSAGLPNDILGHQLIANSYGLALGFYEGGEQLTTSATANAQWNDYTTNWRFDTSMGNTIPSPPTNGNNLASLYAAYYQACAAANSSYPAQYVWEWNPPWTAVRFIPGDTTNAKAAAILAQNALGPWVDPTPPATWTGGECLPYANVGGGTNSPPNYLVAAPTTFTFTATLPATNPAGMKLVVALSGGDTISSITINGTSLAAEATSGGSLQIWGATVGANFSGGVPATVLLTYTGGGSTRCAWVYAFNGLISNTLVTSGSNAGGVTTITFAETKGSAVIAAIKTVGAIASFNFGGGTAGVIPPVSQSYLPVFGAQALFDFNFTSPVMTISCGSGVQWVWIVYR